MRGEIGKQGKRGLEGMRQIAERGARALETPGHGLEQAVELLHQRLHLGRNALREPGDLAALEARELCAQPAHAPQPKLADHGLQHEQRAERHKQRVALAEARDLAPKCCELLGGRNGDRPGPRAHSGA